MFNDNIINHACCTFFKMPSLKIDKFSAGMYIKRWWNSPTMFYSIYKEYLNHTLGLFPPWWNTLCPSSRCPPGASIITMYPNSEPLKVIVKGCVAFKIFVTARNRLSLLPFDSLGLGLETRTCQNF